MNLNQPTPALADISLRKTLTARNYSYSTATLTVGSWCSGWSVCACSSAHGHRILDVTVDNILNQIWPCSVLLCDEIWGTWIIWQSAKSCICTDELFDWCAEIDIDDRSISVCCLACSQLLRAHSVRIS